MNFLNVFDKVVYNKKAMNMKTEFIRPDASSKCTWHINADSSNSPHTSWKQVPRPSILPDILHAIGNTPLVRLNNIPKSCGVRCEMLAKCEFLNPGGSVKDRIAYRMIEDAEKKGSLKPGDVIIEPTAGNTGIGLAMAAAIKGYRCIIVMPEKMSDEKVNVLRALGAEILRTPTGATFDSPESYFAVAQRLQKEIPNSIVLDQFRNPGNPLMHYDTTGEEILRQCNGKVDMVVLAAATGGTITGVARKLKEQLPNIVIVGVDPLGSIMAEPAELNATGVSLLYEVEGIGFDFIPTVCDRSVVDKWHKSNDKESFFMARRLIKEEGLLCGGSSGAIFSEALKAAAHLKEGQRCVVILPDGIRNYMSKFVSDIWMEARGFQEPEPPLNIWWWSHKVANLRLKIPITVVLSATCQEVINIMKHQSFHQIPVVDNTGCVQGIVTIANLMKNLTIGKVQISDPIERVVHRMFQKVFLNTPLSQLSRIFETDHSVLVVNFHKQYSDEKSAQYQYESIIGIVTPFDLLSYITSRDDRDGKEDSKADHMLYI